MKSMVKKAVPNRNAALMALFAATTSPLAMAAGFDDATTMATTIRTGIYTFVGVVCTILLLWQMVEGASHRKTWMDVLVTCLWIIGCGAAIAFGTWLFTKGGSMSFS